MEKNCNQEVENNQEVTQYLEKLGVNSCDCDLTSLRTFIRQATKEESSLPQTPSNRPKRRWQDQVIENAIPQHSKLLDLGCGEGDLLVRLAESRQAVVQGVELDQERVIRCIERGIPVYHGDIESGLQNFPDQSFDYVVMEETLQTLKNPMKVLKELLRVGKRAIVSFPNFAHWSVRLAFGVGGRMPKTKALPYTWHDTPNIHNCSINDFLDWTQEDQVKIVQAWVMANGEVLEYHPDHNLIAEQAMFLIEAGDK